jgi:hypothetical protein
MIGERARKCHDRILNVIMHNLRLVGERLLAAPTRRRFVPVES